MLWIPSIKQLFQKKAFVKFLLGSCVKTLFCGGGHLGFPIDIKTQTFYKTFQIMETTQSNTHLSLKKDQWPWQLSILNEYNGIERDVIALVDDVTGELDYSTKTEFYHVIKQAEQVFFTFTETPSDDFFNEADIFNVENGEITEKQK